MNKWRWIAGAACLALLIGCGGGGSSDPGPKPAPRPEPEPNEAPVADAGQQEVTTEGGSILLLDGSASSDPEGDEITYSWSAQTDSQSLWFLNDDGTPAESLEAEAGKLHIPAGLAGETITVTLVVDDGNSSSTDTVTVTVAGCPSRPGYLFTECMDPSVLSGVVWEQSRTENPDGTRDSLEYFDGDTENHVRWQVLDLQDDDHNKVIDLTFNNDDANGRFRFLLADRIDDPEVSADFSDYSGGNLVFDVRALSPEGDIDIEVSSECTWPCSSGFNRFVINNDWSTISVPVSQLVEGGLELNKVSVPFQVSPVFDQQAGVHLQLDNIRWESADCSEAEGVVYDECVGSGWLGFAAYDDVVNGVYRDGQTNNHITWLERFSGDPAHGEVVRVTFNSEATGNFFVETDDPTNATDMSEYVNGRLVFDLRVIDYGSNTTGLVVRIDCMWPCTSGEIEVDSPEEGEWTTVAVPVADLLAGGLDLEKVSTGLQIFPAGTQTGAVIEIDNARWEKQIP